MKSLEEFRIFYSSELVPKLQQLETKRKKLAFSVLMAITITSVVTGLLYIIIKFWAILAGFIIYIIVHFVFFNKNIKALTTEFKLQIIQNMVKFFDTSFDYFPQQGINQNEFIESKLFLSGIDRYFVDDLVSGKLDKTSLKFSEVHAEYKTESTDNDGHKTTNWNTIFRGIFLIADFNKNFNGRTVVLPDNAEKLLGSFLGNALQKMNFTRDPLVMMDDIEFEKLFCVHSSDQIEVRYILSPKLMERIVKFKKKSGKNIHLSFINSKLFIAISIHQELFEPPFFTTMLNPKLIEEFFEYLYLSISIVEELDLNTRIWTKT